MMPRPIQHLIEAMRLYPRAASMVDDFRARRGNDLPRWPDWCFLPMAAWYAIVAHEHRAEIVPLSLASNISRLAAIGTWRYSQGIYRVDPDLMAGLAESRLPGDLPAEVLHRLPEWCIYVETPGMSWAGTALHGFWAHLEWDANSGRSELRLLLDLDDRLLGLPLHLGSWTLLEAVERYARNAADVAAEQGIKFTVRGEDMDAIVGAVRPLLSILLYLCSDEPEIDDLRQPGSSPARPRPKKTKKGWRLFPPDRPRTWTVGAGIGALLRESALPGDPTGRTVRPHLRRGHWHGYWTGARDSAERRFRYRWLAPIVVAGEQNADRGGS